MERINASGRRKNAIARVYMTPGQGQITVNGRPFEEYFPFEVWRTVVNQPFATVDRKGDFDLKVNVRGGGSSGQAEAVRLAVAKALVQFDEEWKPALKQEGYMTRDPRMTERKKYGRRKARRSFQFSKR